VPLLRCARASQLQRCGDTQREARQARASEASI
jgi:hypothetical protein